MKSIPVEQLFFSKQNDFLNTYLPKHKNGSEATQATYQRSMVVFRSYINAEKHIPTNKFRFEDCTYDILLDFRNYLHDSLGQAESTANNRLAAIKSYVNYVAARDITKQQFAFAVGQVPFYSVPRVMQPVIDDTDALAALLSMPPNTKKGLRDKVIMSILYDGGIRVKELVSLKVRSFDLNDDNISYTLIGKGNVERIDVLDVRTSALIRQYLDEFHPKMTLTEPFIYTEINGARHQMSIRNVQKLIKRYADKTRKDHKLPDSVTPHTFRRTRGTLLYRDGVPLEAIASKLGHANTQVTRQHYTSTSDRQMREMASKRAKVIPDEVQEWPDDEEEIDKLLGL